MGHYKIGGRRPEWTLPAKTPHSDKSLREVQAYIHTLAATWRAQPATAVTDTLQSDTVRHIAILRIELDRLTDKVVGMSEVVGLMSRHEGKV
jgi:hypothetical protein